MIPYPLIDPVALQIGSLSIRWYGLAYVAGIILGWKWGVYLIKRLQLSLSETLFSDYIPWAALGIVAGGRLGHVIFYNLSYYIQHPLEIFYIWHPGMSFHGGILGVILVTLLYDRRHNIALKPFADLLAVSTPLGLFFGRIANFINAELVGRPTNVPWAMIFPGSDGQPRHPSQLYEAAFEGIFLFILLNYLFIQKEWYRKYTGATAGLFILGYGCIRICIENVREPDAHIGYIFGFFTLGQLYSLPLVLAGFFMLWQVSWTPASHTPLK